MRYLGEVHRGVRGFVKDERNAPVEGASLKIKGRDVGFQTTKYGEYWRVLLPGRYAIEVRGRTSAPRRFLRLFYLLFMFVLPGYRG